MKLLSRLVIALVICLLAIPLIATPVQAATGDFSIASGGSVSTGKGYVGDSIRISGTADCTRVYIYYELYNESDEDEWYQDYIEGDWDDVALEYDYSDYFDIPESCAGEHDIRLCSTKDPDKDVDTVVFTVYPYIEIDDESGPAGTEVGVSGTGWHKNESEIEIRFYLQDPGTTHYDDDDYYVEISAQDIDINEYGSWEDITFEVPPACKGTHWIYAVGDECDDIEDDYIKGVEFEVTPGISIDLTSGSPGTTVTVRGSGFEEDEEDIDILFDGKKVKENIMADEDGCWEGTFEVPQAAADTYDVTAEGETTDKADIDEVEFEVVPGISLSPTEGHVGTSLTVSGSGLPASTTVTVTYDGVNQSTGITTAEGSLTGITFEATHTQNEHTAEHPVVVTYDTTTVARTFTMESDAPSKPTLALPANGSRMGVFRKQAPTFEWSAVTDDSGVSYNLEISKSADFAQVLISRTGLTEASCTLTGAEALDYGTYYWRVKAIDGAMNDSGWSIAYSLKSGYLPLWAFVAIIAVLVVLIGVLAYFFLRRRGTFYD